MTEGLEQPKRQFPALNVMAIHGHRHANISKQATLLGGVDVDPPKWRVCGCDLNRFIHEGINDISNVKVHLKTRSGNVNIVRYLEIEKAHQYDISGPKVIKFSSCSTQLSMKFQLLIKLKYRQMKKFPALSLSDVVFIMLINVKMPTIVGILTFMSRINFGLS